jgi:hypothetical protein
MSTIILTRPVNYGKTNNSTPSDRETLKIVKTFMCESSASIGDPVVLSETENNKVIVPTDNITFMPIFGIIERKDDDVTCDVISFGYSDLIFTDLQKNKSVFLSGTGSLTNSVPDIGYMQIIGLAYEDNRLYVNPSLHLTLMG